MPNKPPLDPVIVSLNGREHACWKRYEIDSDLFIPADDWEMTLAIPAKKPDEPLTNHFDGQSPSRSASRGATAPFGDRGGEQSSPCSASRGATAPLYLWQKAVVRIGEDTVLSGRIDRIRRRTAKGERTLTLTGRDMAGVLCDCSAPIFTAQNITLEAVVSAIAKTFGIARVNITANGLREKVSVEPGMSAWDAIALACELNGCHAWFEPDGTLTIGGPDYTAPPVGTLFLDADGKSGRTNVLSLDVDQNISRYFSEVSVLAQAHGTAKVRGLHNVKEAETDALLLENGIYRPKIVVDGDAENASYAAKLARKYIADGKFSALTIRAEVRGHRAFDGSGKGPVWTPGQRVRVVSVPDGIDDVFLLAGRTMTFSEEDAQKTRLTLKPDNVWLPDAGKRKKKGGKNKGDGRIIKTWE